jgi:hypothetical protein
MHPNLFTDGLLTNWLLRALYRVVGSPGSSSSNSLSTLQDETGPNPVRDHEDIRTTEWLLVGAWTFILAFVLVLVAVIASSLGSLRSGSNILLLAFVFGGSGQLLHGLRAVRAARIARSEKSRSGKDRIVPVEPWSSDSDLIVQAAPTVLVLLALIFAQ